LRESGGRARSDRGTEDIREVPYDAGPVAGFCKSRDAAAEITGDAAARAALLERF